MKIVCDCEKIEIANFAISAPFFIEYDGKAFPERDWYELIALILDDWGWRLREVLSCENKEIRFDFMEGIMGFICRLVEGKFHVTAWSDVIAKKGKEAEFTAEIDEFVHSYADCALGLLRWYDENREANQSIQWFNEVKDQLSDHIVIIRKAAKDVRQF